MSVVSQLYIERSNRRQLLMLTASHLVWSCALVVLWVVGSFIAEPAPWLSGLFLALQLYAACQLLLPVLRSCPAARTRGFYLFWGAGLVLLVWLVSLLPSAGLMPVAAALKSGVLLLSANLVGAALARYVKRLWEILPLCAMMALADFSSWLAGPTADFAEQIRNYYRAPAGPPPLVDMLLVKLALPGVGGLVPVFGISDWIMVAFFACVAHHHGVNDNLLGASGGELARSARFGRYLPVSAAALFSAILLAQLSGLFVPALPLIALIMLLWYVARHLLGR